MCLFNAAMCVCVCDAVFVEVRSLAAVLFSR